MDEVEEQDLLIRDVPIHRVFVSCPFQKECWRDIRRPKIREAAKQGIRMHLPYICSYQVEGDLEKCSHHDNYMKSREKGEVSVNGGSN